MGKGNAIARAAMMSGVAMIWVQPASAAAIYFDIPAQPLSQALVKFGLASKKQVIFSPDSVRGLTSKSVKGELGAGKALGMILEGSGLTARVREQAYVITPVAQSAAVPPPTAQADEQAPPENGGGFGDIVVTAQRREQRLQDVPVSATVTTGEQLAKSNVINLEDLSARLPNLRIATAPANNLLNIRGVGSGLNPGFEQAVGTFVDGVYRGRSRAINPALFDLERVEVLKGPQTTFFGNNTIAGALNITTRKPGKEFGYNASALYSPSDGEYAIEGGITAPLTPTLSARVAVKAYGMDGYVSNSFTGDDQPHSRNFVARGSLAWEPTENFRSDIRVDYGRMRSRDGFPTELLDCPPDPVFGAAAGLCARYLAASGGPVDDELDYHTNKFETPSSYDFWEVAATNQLDIGDHRLTSITSYFEHDNDTVITAAPLPVPGVGGLPNAFILHLPETLEQWSQELRIESPSGGLIEYMAGLYYSRGDLDAQGYSGFYFAPFGMFAGPPFGPTTPIATTQPFRQKDTVKSAFASLAINPVDSLTINLGARYSIVKKKVLERDWVFGTAGAIPGPDNFVAGPPSVQAPLRAILGGLPDNFDDPDRTDKKFMPSANLQYRLTGDITTYVSYTKGFKAGGFGGTIPDKVRFDPETVDAYEIGVKGSLLDRSLYFSVAAFQSDYDDLQEATQVLLPSGAILARIANVAKARAKGVEIGVNWRLSDNISVTGDVAYLDAKYRRYERAPCTILGSALDPSCVQDMAGKRRGFAPKWSGNAGLSLSIPLDEATEIRFDPSLYFSSRYFQSATADPLLEQEGWVKFDARLAVGSVDGSWELAIIGKNLSDKATGSFRNFVPSSPGTFYALPDRPRSVAIQFSIRK